MLQARHLLIKNKNSRNPVSRRTNESTAGVEEQEAIAILNDFLNGTNGKPQINADNFADVSDRICGACLSLKLLICETVSTYCMHSACSSVQRLW